MADISPQRAKILYFITKSNWGGAQRHVFDLATNLSPKEFDVAVIVGGNGILKTRLQECGVRTMTIETLGRDMNAGKDLGSLSTFYKLLKKETPTILHTHSPKAGGLGAFAARLYNLSHKQKITVIYTVHGWPFNENRNTLSKTLILLFSWLTCVFSNKVIVLGNREKEQTSRWPWVKNKFEIIKIGIAKPAFLARTKARDFISSVIGKKISKNTIIIGTIAELHKNKGYPFLIRALADIRRRIPQFLFVSIGTGEERASLEKLVREKELVDNVIFLGQLHNAALYLKAFDIFTLTSTKEGLPYTIIEAGKAELPIISSHVGNIPEIIDDMRSGILIKPGNIREIAEAIQFLIDNPHKREEFAHNAYKKMNEDYSLSRMMDGTIKLYRHYEK